jgi:hypothetical protein
MKDLKAAFILALCIGLVVLVSTAHCSINSKKSNTTCFLPEGCVTQYTENPLMYQMGKIAEASNVDGNLNIRFQPTGTYALYDESILFCGLPVDMFRNAGNVIVLTYKRQASHLVGGVGCHDLVHVNEVK